VDRHQPDKYNILHIYDKDLCYIDDTEWIKAFHIDNSKVNDSLYGHEDLVGELHNKYSKIKEAHLVMSDYDINNNIIGYTLIIIWSHFLF
jgi:hypothetical protein